MDSVSYTEAWRIWASGESISQRYLFGVQILWWAESARLLLSSAALAVLAEIAGSARISAFGSSLRVKYNFGATLRGLLPDFLRNFGEDDTRKNAILNNIFAVATGAAYALFVSFFLLDYLFAFVWRHLTNHPRLASFLVTALLAVGLIVFFLLFYMAVTLCFGVIPQIGKLFDVALFRPAAKVLEHAQPAKRIQVIGLLIAGTPTTSCLPLFDESFELLSNRLSSYRCGT
jgi:hypothetical protein